MVCQQNKLHDKKAHVCAVKALLGRCQVSVAINKRSKQAPCCRTAHAGGGFTRCAAPTSGHLLETGECHAFHTYRNLVKARPDFPLCPAVIQPCLILSAACRLPCLKVQHGGAKQKATCILCASYNCKCVLK